MRLAIFIFLVLIVLFGSFFIASELKADSNDNVWGWAWAGEGIGWISFNCYNDYGSGLTGHCIADGYTSDYGVHICETDNDPHPYCGAGSEAGEIRGYAWMGLTPPVGLGYINFNQAGPYPAAPNWSACLSVADTGEPCDAEPPGTVSGWAYSVGLSAWIKLKGPLYTVSLDTLPDPDEFTGWAWGNGGGILNWISFNCSNQGVCGSSNYKVLTNANISIPNNPPSAINLSETIGDYCFKNSPPIILNWEFSDPNPGDTQSAYQVQVDSDCDFAPSDIDSGVVSSSSNQYAPSLLLFNQAYCWRVKVWDDAVPAGESVWANDNFTTDQSWPEPNFDWNPASPGIGVPIQFCSVNDGVNCFVNLTTCSAGCSSWAWDFDDGTPVDPAQNPIHSYVGLGLYTVELTVQDSNSNSCKKNYAVNVGGVLDLPGWREIPPDF